MLKIEQLHAGYGTAAILEGLDLELHQGEVLSVLGRNGMGKTTMVRSVAGMRPPGITSGSITLEGDEVSELESYQIARRGVGIVPQGRHVFGSLTVLENLNVIARPTNGASNWTTDRVFEFFPRLGERSNSFASNLSGGEQQMLAIGRALMTNPRLLLMDEPSEGLAPIVIGNIRDRLASLKGPELSILLVEQNLGLALALADRIAIMGPHGKIVWTGTPGQLETDEETKKTHLGV